MPGDATDDDQVRSAQSRWAFTNDLLAGVIVAAVYGIRATTLVWGIDPPPGLPWATDIVLPALAGAWLFGRGAVKSVTRLRGGSGE